MENTTSDVYEVEPYVEMHSFQEVICEALVLYQVLRLQDSVFIWVGPSENPVMENLSLGRQTCYGDLPLETRILGFGSDTTSTVASRIARKIGQPAYVSINIPHDKVLLPAVEKRLFEEIKQHPKKFNL